MNLDALSHTKSGAAPYSGISPLPFWKAIFFFALPAIGFRLAIYAGMPALMSAGLTQFEAHVVSFTVPSAILLALALGFFQREGQPVTWATMRERFRLRRLTKHDWLWTIGGFLFAFLAGGMLTVAARQLIVAIPAIAPPDFFLRCWIPGLPCQQPSSPILLVLHCAVTGACSFYMPSYSASTYLAKSCGGAA
jgi:hypothetical protein